MIQYGTSKARQTLSNIQIFPDAMWQKCTILRGRSFSNDWTVRSAEGKAGLAPPLGLAPKLHSSHSSQVAMETHRNGSFA